MRKVCAYAFSYKRIISFFRRFTKNLFIISSYIISFVYFISDDIWEWLFNRQLFYSVSIETDLDTLIQKNSIPNNLRTVNNQGICNQDLRGSPLQSPSSSEIFPRDNSSKNPLLSGEEDDRCKKGSPKSAIDDSSRHRKTSSAKLHQYCSSETSPSTNKTNYTSVSLVDKDNDDLPFDGKDLVAVVDNDVFTTTPRASTVSLHKMRRFEPPPPYTRRSDGSSDPIAFV